MDTGENGRGVWGPIKPGSVFAREMRRRNASIRAAAGVGVVLMLRDALGRWKPWTVRVMP